MRFNDAVSKVTISPETTQHHPSNREKMLKWIQDNPNACKHTTFSKICEISLIPGLNTRQKKMACAALMRSQLLYVKTHGKSNKAPKDIYINYMHRNLPKSILDNAPDKELEDAKRVILGDNMKKEAQKILAERRTELEQAEQTSTQAEQTSTPSIEVPLDTDLVKQGFSLTLNINFTINKGK